MDQEGQHKPREFAHEVGDPKFIECFVENGFVIAKSVFPPTLIKNIYQFISSRYEKYKSDYLKQHPKNQVPVLGISRKIVEEWQKDPLHKDMIESKVFLDGMERILGPDLAMVNWTNLWINDPQDPSDVTAKAIHQEAWSGWSLDDITTWVPFHKPLREDTMSVIPGSHYFGLMPNRNRKVLCPEGFEMPEAVPLTDLEEGDAVYFHSLLLHATSGRSDRIRYASSFVIRNSFAPLSRVNYTRGFTGVRQGPLSKINMVLGNDYLTPLRTYGGAISNYDYYDDNLE